MDPVLLLVPGFLGGVLFALAIAAFRKRFHSRSSSERSVTEPLATDAINMSSIRVAGVGGLGLVAMAVAVAWNIPRIGSTLEIGLFLGAIMAVALIVVRSRRGPMPSSGRHGGANAILAIDDRLPSAESDRENPDEPKFVSGVPIGAPHRA